MDAEKRKKLALLRNWLLALLLLAVFLVGYLVVVGKDMSDFGVCYKAGQRIVKGETLYRASDGHLQYKYAPVAADFYAGFALFHWPTAKIVWYILSIAILAGAAFISYRVVPEPRKKAIYLVGFTILVMAKCLGREIQLGQVNIFIIFLLTAMVWLFISKKDLAAGAIWGVSLFFKPYALVFLPYFILKRRWKALAGGAVALLAGFFVPVINYGFQGNWAVLKEWFSSLSQSTPGLLAVGDNASLFAVVLKATHGRMTAGAVAALGVCAAVIGLGLLVMIFSKKRRDAEDGEGQAYELAYLMVLIPLFSPLGWNYNYLYGFLAIMLLLNGVGLFSPAIKVLAVVNFFLIGATLRETLGKGLFRFYTRNSFIALSFLIVLALLLVLRMRSSRSSV